MFRRALVCTDFKDGLHRLVQFVPSLKSAGLNHITFLHTLALPEDREIPRPDEEREQEVRDRLTTAMSEVPEGMTVEVDVQSGKPSDHIERAIKAHQAEVVFLGMPSRSRLTERLFGSTTIGLCKRLTVPLLILRPQLVSTYTIEELNLRCQHLFRYLLLPYDESKAARYLIDSIERYAKEQTEGALARCLLFRSVDDVSRKALEDVQSYKLQEAETSLNEVKPRLEEVGLSVETIVRQGQGIPELLHTAMEYDITAIALSSDSFGKLIEISSPSFAGEVLRRSWHPVLYFPPGR
ncbi:MAG: universal stress protein [Cyanobacteria bacterium P01_A01_bin.135]